MSRYGSNNNNNNKNGLKFQKNINKIVENLKFTIRLCNHLYYK